VQAALASDADLVNEPSDIKALVANIRGALRTIVDTTCHEERVTCGVVCNVHNTVNRVEDEERASKRMYSEVVIEGAITATHHSRSPSLSFYSLFLFFQVKNLESDPDISTIIESRGVLIVGAYYAFNGAVTFFDKTTLNDGVQHLVSNNNVPRGYPARKRQ